MNETFDESIHEAIGRRSNQRGFGNIGNDETHEGSGPTQKVLSVDPENVLFPPEIALSTVIPGLKLVENFITIEEEDAILHKLDENAWIKEMSRRVQHFGFRFNYRNLMIDFGTEASKFPDVVEEVAKRIECGSNSPKHWAKSISLNCIDGIAPNNPFLYEEHLDLPLSQVTANEYYANQGIAPHIDTSACFGPLIFIVTCGSGTTMTFKKMTSSGYSERSKYGEGLNSGSAKEHVWLSRRSLLILCSDARYSWSHGIASRKFDKINGSVVKRKRRVSLTFRQALIPGEIPAENLRASSMEKKNVFDFYDEIAEHWHHTRGKRKVHWRLVKEFLTSMPKGSLLADIGCGDGKYFGVNDEVVSIGCDRSLNLLKVSHNITDETFCCDAVKLPFKDQCFDASMCIAVMHHLGSVDRRIAVVRELMRITKIGGSILIQAWALEQEESSKRKFIQQDVMVPWRVHRRFLSVSTTQVSESRSYQHLKKNQPAFDVNACPGIAESTTACAIDGRDDLITYERYCHMFKNGELENLCSSIPGCMIVDRGFDRSNWFVVIKKFNDKRIFMKREGDDLFHDIDSPAENQSEQRRINAAAIPQPMPHIALRTLS